MRAKPSPVGLKSYFLRHSHNLLTLYFVRFRIYKIPQKAAWCCQFVLPRFINNYAARFLYNRVRWGGGALSLGRKMCERDQFGARSDSICLKLLSEIVHNSSCEQAEVLNLNLPRIFCSPLDCLASKI